ncbi:MAG: hypothetical protein AAF958_00805 [Planctomycetota bacterium]
MAKFQDKTGDEWIVDISVFTIEQARTRAAVDLAKMDGELFEVLETDPVKLANVLFVCCEQQAQQRDVTDVDFGRRLGGKAIAEGTRALLEALVDFFPNRGAAIMEAQRHFEAIEKQAIERVAERIGDGRMQEAAMGMVDRTIDEAIAKLQGKRDTKTTNRKTRSKSPGK